MQQIIDFIYNIVWSDALVYLCLLTGVYFTIRFKFPQITHIKHMFTLLFKGCKSEKGISSFQAFSLAVSGRVGTGNYIAETNISFIQSKSTGKYLINILRLLILISVFVGCITTAKTAWDLGDIGVGLMAWLNLIAIILLHKKVLILFKDYNNQHDSGKDPEFNNSKTKFPNMEIWNKK